MHGSHHALQHRVHELPSLLRVTVSQDEFQRPLQVRKEHGHLLALAFQGTPGGQDFLRQIGECERHAEHGPGALAGREVAAEAEPAAPIQTRTLPRSIHRQRWPSMSSFFKSSRAASSSWNCRLRVP